jgi:hypothetical protein
LRTSLEGGRQQLHSVADKGRGNHRSRKPPLANPFLTGARNTITSSERKAQPGVALARVPQFFKGAARPNGHVIVLAGDHADMELP